MARFKGPDYESQPQSAGLKLETLPACMVHETNCRVA